jgi:hypothetical protein
MLNLLSYKKIFLFIKYFFYNIFFYKKKKIFISAKNKKKVLYFLPEAGLDAYVETQIKIANYLKKINYDVTFVRCHRVFNKCQFKNALNVNYGLKNKIFGNLACEVCLAKSLMKLGTLDFNTIDLYNDSNLINIKDIENKFFNSSNVYDFIKYKYLGIKIAKLALYDFFIEKKKTNLKDITFHEINELRFYVISAVQAINSLENIKKKYNFNYIFLRDEYSMMSAINLWCKNKKVKVYRIEGAYLFNYSHKYINFLKSKSTSEERQYLNKNWSYFRVLPLKKEIISDLYKDLFFRMTNVGGHIFSTNYNKYLGEDIFKILNLEKNKRVLVAYTSSADEMAAITVNSEVFKLSLNKNDAFISQLDWIKKIINYVECNSKQFQLIIRIHPRSLSNKKEIESYKNYFINKKLENVRIVYPEDKISSFNLAEIADLALVSWSNIALELLRLGVPVLSGYQSNCTIFPKENLKNYSSSNNENDYFDKIKFMSKYTPNISDIIKGLRWCNYLYLGNSINLLNLKHNYDNSSVVKNNNLVNSILQNNSCVVEEVVKEKINKNINHENTYYEKKYVLENLTKLNNFFNKFPHSLLQNRIETIIKS